LIMAGSKIAITRIIPNREQKLRPGGKPVATSFVFRITTGRQFDFIVVTYWLTARKQNLT